MPVYVEYKLEKHLTNQLLSYYVNVYHHPNLLQKISSFME